MNGRQISAARALIRMTQADLAALANISVPTLKRMESSNLDVLGTSNNVRTVRLVLEKQGISFLERDSRGTGPGVSFDPDFFKVQRRAY